MSIHIVAFLLPILWVLLGSGVMVTTTLIARSLRDRFDIRLPSSSGSTAGGPPSWLTGLHTAATAALSDAFQHDARKAHDVGLGWALMPLAAGIIWLEYEINTFALAVAFNTPHVAAWSFGLVFALIVLCLLEADEILKIAAKFMLWSLILVCAVLGAHAEYWA